MAGNEKKILDECISGYHEYALTSPVHLTFVSSNLCAFLGCLPEELLSDSADLYMPLVHPADSGRYAAFLEELSQSEKTGRIEYRIMKKTGEMLYVADSMTSRKGKDGNMYGFSMLTDLTELKKENDNLQFTNSTIPCGMRRYAAEGDHGVTYMNDAMKDILRIPSDAASAGAYLKALEESVFSMIGEESRDRAARALQSVERSGAPYSGEVDVLFADGRPGRLFGWISRCRNRDGGEEFQSICVDVTDRYLENEAEESEKVSALETENAEQRKQVSALQDENASLKEQNEGMQRIVQHFTEGGAAFEILGEYVRPLYASDNAYEFFGYSGEDWSEMLNKSHTIREFVSRTGLEYERFEELFDKGEAEFVYRDVRTGRKRTIRAVCSSLEKNPSKPKYVMLYNTDKEQEAGGQKQPSRVRIRTFGYFDVFVDGKPIVFKNEKPKELLALLVDRKGGFVSSEEAIGVLWEDEPASPVVLARYRKVALRLKNLLEEYDIAGIMESVSGKRRIVPEEVECDLYEYLSGREVTESPFRGSYLNNYSWAEVTLGELMNRE